MKINEHLVKISAGYIVIPNELKMDEEVALIVKGQVTKIEDKSNQDGTIDRIYTVKGEIAGELANE